MIRPTLLGITIFASLTLLLFLVISIIPTRYSKERYHSLVEGAAAKVVNRSEHEQRREGVRKDLYMIRDGIRYRAHLSCPESHLTLVYERGNSQLVEKLKKFTCLMQEGCVALQSDGTKAPMIQSAKGNQYVREFTAGSGIFNYHKYLITADRVFLSRYLLPGTELPTAIQGVEPLMKGVARTVDLNFSEGYTFNAKNMKATFFRTEHP